MDEKIAQEKVFLKEATKLVEGEENLKFFKDHKKFLQEAEGLAETEEQKAILWFHFVDLRNKITFLLFRTKKLTETLESQFFSLPAIEEAHKEMRKAAEPRQARQAEIKNIIDGLHEQENKLDIFKAVCNGMSKEKAEEELAQYEKQLLQGAQGVQQTN